MVRRFARQLLLLVLIGISTSTLAEPTGVPVKILSLRPYNTPTGGNIYVEVS